MKPVDLHMHTSFSDGRLSPKETVRLAEKNNLKVIAITDHETINGLKNLNLNTKIKIIPGIEIPCSGDFNFPKVDIVGLFININNRFLNEFLNKNFKKDNQFKKYIRRIIAKTIIFESFTKFILKVYRKNFHVSNLNKNYPSISEAVSVIKKAGGIAVLAHPGIIPSKELIKVIKLFVKAGGKAIEVNYPYSKTFLFTEEEQKSKINEISSLAKKYHLLASGGSDFHGGERKVTIGEEGITLEEFKKLETVVNLLNIN